MLIKQKKYNFLSHLSVLLLIFLFFSFFPFEAFSSFELWQKIQLQGKNIGYSVVRVKGDSVEEVMNMKLKAMGQKREVKAQLLWSKNPDYSFKTFEFQLKSEGNSVLVKGKVEGKNLSVQIGQSKKSFSIPEKVFTGSSFIFLISDKIKSGNQIRNFSLLYFDPSVLRLDILSFELSQKTEDYFVFKKTFAGISSFVYFDKNGNFLKEEGSMGISSVASSRKDIISSPPEDVDIIFSTSVAVEGKYPDSSQRRNIKRAVLFVWGVDDLPPYPPRQVVSKKGYGFLVELTNSLLSDTNNLEIYTKPELLIESESQEMKKLAESLKNNIEGENEDGRKKKNKRIFEKEKLKEGNNIIIIQGVSDWVFQNVKKTSVLNMPSALQVLKTMRGDCNEHSILTVAILRALGIPSRVVFGLVYDSGLFFYHAWVEAFDGKNWIEFDPTWGLFPADILRIRIGTGNVSEWVKVLEYVGKIKIKFLDWQ